MSCQGFIEWLQILLFGNASESPAVTAEGGEGEWDVSTFSHELSLQCCKT
jgi:hypothetical protein